MLQLIIWWVTECFSCFDESLTDWHSEMVNMTIVFYNHFSVTELVQKCFVQTELSKKGKTNFSIFCSKLQLVNDH